MTPKATITKQGFWNRMYQEYPKAMKVFCAWIDQYKAEVDWNALFKANETTDQLQSSTYKFHEIPYELQQGIWLSFAYETVENMFEQAEYSYRGNIEDDAEEVFSSIEEYLD